VKRSRRSIAAAVGFAMMAPLTLAAASSREARPGDAVFDRLSSKMSRDLQGRLDALGPVPGAAPRAEDPASRVRVIVQTQEAAPGATPETMRRFLARPGPEITVGCGETVVKVTGAGSGGRNTHAALLAAQRLAGTDDLFVSFATDGVDAGTGSAGAIVDGTTIDRGGDPSRALADFDSASYLAAVGDLLICPPTGTNVADLWILWRQPPAAT
jgi:hypothetical protein